MRIGLHAGAVFMAVQAAGAGVDFFGVKSGARYEEADQALVQRLNARAQADIANTEWLSYGDAIRKSVDWKKSDGVYLARMTPYAYVAAQMLGASFEPLAVYRSLATGQTTYHAYFVVNRRNFPAQPKLEELLTWIRAGKRKFIYHDKFSTSSFFQPSLYFRSQRVFAMEAPSAGLAAIEVKHEPHPDGSSHLVHQVAAGEADLAAVWDEKKTFYEQPAQRDVGGKVWFVRLSRALPNDLLVCSTWLDDGVKQRIRQAIRDMAAAQERIGFGDFLWWEDMQSTDGATAAREALSALRRAATATPAPVAIRVEADPRYERYVEAARQAIRLSGTEFVVYDRDFHGRADIVWKLQLIHDDAIRLESEIRGSGLDPQQFHVSFDFDKVEEDLTKRLGAILHSRMHRIRYVWPYEEQDPTVIRDVDFSLRPDARVRVQKIAWKEPERNSFDPTRFQDARVAGCDFHKFRLKDYPFPKSADTTSYAFDPMGNVAYQVILMRPSEERLVFKLLTAAFVCLLLLAGAGAAVDVRRQNRKEGAAAPPPEEFFERACQEIAERPRARWRQRPIADADIIWCDRARIEELIEELKAGGLKPEFDAVQRQERRAGFLLKVPLLHRALEGSLSRTNIRELVADPRKLGDAARLASLVRFLVEQGLLSRFAGKPSEWEAIDRVARWIFPSPAGGTESRLMRPDDPAVLQLASEHFNAVLEESLQKASLFQQAWEVTESDDRFLLCARTELLAGLRVGTQTVHALAAEFNLPRNRDMQEALRDQSAGAWLLGRIRHQSYVPNAGHVELRIHFRTLAVLRG